MVTAEEEATTMVKEEKNVVTVPCSVEGCQYVTPETEMELAVTVLHIHADSVHVGQAVGIRGEK